MNLVFKQFAVILGLSILAATVLPCTIAVVAGSEGRGPLLWKNRDVLGIHQEVRYFTSEPFEFIANVYEGEFDRVWSGVNSAGLAIINSDTYNQGPWGSYGDDDGHVMFHALGNFSTIDEFQAYLDSTNTTVRRSTHCYGLIDATGSAVLFEAGRDYYVRYDASEAPEGVIVRTNYADSGGESDRIGTDRRARAESLLMTAQGVEPEMLLFGLARDLTTEELDPYPLPFEGVFRGYSTGIIEASTSINRFYTSSACVIDGTFPPTMWQFLGQPICAIPIPLWIHAKSLPEGLCGTEGSALCDMAIDMKSLVYTGTYTIDTYALSNILSSFAPVEAEICARVRAEIGSDSIADIDPAVLGNLQTQFAEAILAKYWEIRSLFVKESRRETPSKAGLSVYPNPFNASGNIVFHSERAGTAEVQILDLNGRVVANPANSFWIYRGENRIPLSMEGLPSGIYSAVLALEGAEVQAASFVLIK